MLGDSEISRHADESVGGKELNSKPDRREYFHTMTNLAVKLTAMMQLRPRTKQDSKKNGMLILMLSMSRALKVTLIQ